METETKLNSPVEESLPDFTELETSINQLVEVLKEDFAEREKEKSDLAAKEKKEQAELLMKEEQELTEVKISEEKLLEDKTVDETYKENLLSVQMDQAETSTDLLTEIQTLNENTLLLMESTDKQNDLIIEGSLTLILTIIIVAAVKVFIDQVTKW